MHERCELKFRRKLLYFPAHTDRLTVAECQNDLLVAIEKQYQNKKNEKLVRKLIRKILHLKISDKNYIQVIYKWLER